MLTNPEHDAVAQAPRIIFNLESLLIDTVAGVRHALGMVTGKQHKIGAFPLSQEDLRSRSLSRVISDIAGDADQALIAELATQYWQTYKKESRFRAPLLPGAKELVVKLSDMGAELHYVSTWGPTVATQFVQRHRLEKPITSIFTPSTCTCPCARSSLFENFMQAQQHPAASYLLLSDSHAELLSAQRLGVPAIALAYGQTPGYMLETIIGLLGVAKSVDDVGDWIEAHSTALHCLRATARRRSFTLH